MSVHVLQPTGNTTHSFIFLHGYDCSGKENAEHVESWSHANNARYPGLKVVCPDAPLIKTSAPGYGTGYVHSWYDFLDGDCTSPDDKPVMETLEKSCSYIHEIIRRESEIVGSTKVFVGGVSQGCGAALHACCTSPIGPLGGFYGSIGHVMPCTDISNLSNKVIGPIVFYSGAQDDVMNWDWVKHTFMRLHGQPRVEFWREDGVKHEDDGHWVANFLSMVVPPPSVEEQLTAYEQRDNTHK